MYIYENDLINYDKRGREGERERERERDEDREWVEVFVCVGGVGAFYCVKYDLQQRPNCCDPFMYRQVYF